MSRLDRMRSWFEAAGMALRLPPYTYVLIEKKMKKYSMEVEVDKTYLSVTVKVNPAFWSKPVDAQKFYLAHEIWHVTAHRVDRKAEEAIARLVELDEGEDGARFEREYLEESEKLADHAAALLVSMLPEWSAE